MQAERAAGLLLVLALHGAVLYGLWRQRLLPAPAEEKTVFVHFIAPPQPSTPPKSVKLEPPRPQPAPQQLAAQMPQPAPAETVAQPAPAPATVAAPAPEPAKAAPPAGPLTLGTELALVCAERPPPAYPALSRRLGEEGKVVLRVELDTQGQVDAAQVVTGSGHSRLDQAALAAVRNWRCQAARRDGQAVRAVALQPFNFVLGGG